MEIRKANKIVYLIPIWGDQRSKPAMQTLENLQTIKFKIKKIKKAKEKGVAPALEIAKRENTISTPQSISSSFRSWLFEKLNR